MSVLKNGALLQDKIKTLNSLTEKLKNLDTAKKIKGTVFERWGKTFELIYIFVI